ncbi:MAG: neutral/alkaline non-lysosomal ceramidase N-terminal domain-containing protein [Elusimicrobia bacterium]|nr:neutral/alkaline non-lysosomal ceramidase N-terminal domain-containing protein [Elusimicrobiota bacterium]
MVFTALLLQLTASLAGAHGFRVAAGKADITPDLRTETTWMAGYGASGRRPTGVHDPFYARALVVSDEDKTVALVALDNIGTFREDVEAIRRELGWTGGKKYLFLAATHTHSGPDTEGLWGRFPAVSGVDARYHSRMLKTVVELVRGLSARLEPARLSAARADVEPHGLCRDSRDPVVIDPELDAVQFLRDDGKSLGTLVRWSCHPEVMERGNRELTPDFPGALCARVEAKTGGPCVYFSGAIGGMMTPDVDHSKGTRHEFAEVKRVGERVADLALAAFRKERIEASGGPVGFESRIVRVPVENSRYLIFLPNLVFGHKLFHADGRPMGALSPYWLSLRHLMSFPLPDALRPRVETEVSLVRLGPVQLLGIPGELLPELAIGGYDGRYRFGYPLVDPSNPNPPDLKRAPKGPYLREKLKSRSGIIVGLANDHLGYIIPAYDFQVAHNRSMEPHVAGTHYEETNSVGPSATAIILKACDELLK